MVRRVTGHGGLVGRISRPKARNRTGRWSGCGMPPLRAGAERVTPLRAGYGVADAFASLPLPWFFDQPA
jgi:hypothetical protein